MQELLRSGTQESNSLLQTKETAAANAATSDPSCLNYFLPCWEGLEQAGTPVPVQANMTELWKRYLAKLSYFRNHLLYLPECVDLSYVKILFYNTKGLARIIIYIKQSLLLTKYMTKLSILKCDVLCMLI